MMGKGFILVEDQVRLLTVEHVMPAGQPQSMLGPRADGKRLDDVGIDGIRPLAGQPRENGAIGAMPSPRQGQRAVQIDTHSVDFVQQARLF
jgi:hypothetical protein